MSDYQDEKDAEANVSPSTTDIDGETLRTFLEELTLLTRKYKLLISSEGDREVFDVYTASFNQVQSGRYIPFWRHDRETSWNVRSPCAVVFAPDPELQLNTIDIDNI